VRLKGGLALHVHRQRGSASEEAVSGGRFADGDRLRFVVDLPAPGQVMIQGVEATGNVYRAWPLDGAAAPLPAGPGQVLPGAVSLDGARGRELLYLVHCPGPPTCTGAPPRCQPGCATTAFVLDKGE
jgi:hypothetical protein